MSEAYEPTIAGKSRIGGILRNGRLARISVLSIPDRPGVAAALLKALGQRKLNVQFIVQCIDEQNRDHIVLCVERGDLDACQGAIQEIVPMLQAEHVSCDANAASIGIFGPDFRWRPGIAGVLFQALASKSINILAISTSISTVMCVISADDLPAAEAAIQEAFDVP
ncbi:MAG: ACT domain-containing protein [Chloroflexi bacterium]|nr:ACT domain-containing protein [Chloroflexota bacterium]